ncbi:MAG TPA: DUF1844 domain-containing protein [Candidatus Binataceae bacterium]|jgi:hypothetical protein|nr:DUF1844 domain-containing protein [Candidatus Binataceae bacterium]
MIEREDEEKSRGFKVDDRRRFSAEGEPKPEHEAAETPPPHPQPAQEPPPRQREPQAGAQAPPPPEINFVTFVVSLSTQALMHLGEIPDPISNQPERDLPAAQHVIDILGMLQEKTRGNLDHDEEGLLRSILFDLRMKYVETARHHHG